MLPWIFLASSLYAFHVFYKHSWEDLMDYCEMKTLEYMGYQDYSENNTKTDVDYVEVSTEAVSSNTSNDICENTTIEISLLESMRDMVVDKCAGHYFDMLTSYYKFRNTWNQWSALYPSINYINRGLNYGIHKWNSVMCSYCIEPEQNGWVSNIGMYRVKQENGRYSYNLHESYMYAENERELCALMEGCVEKNRNVRCELKDVPVGIIHVMDNLVICKKHDSKYIVARNVVSLPSSFSSSNPARAKFMSVEYTHPRMTYGVPIDIPSNMYIAGNQLFTPTYVLRALKYQEIPFHFDMDYKIKIMDNAMNIIELTSSQYIVLTANGYNLVYMSYS